MRNLDWYIDTARSRAGIVSDGKLSLGLGLARITVNQWRQRKSWPAESHMIELAKLAGIDPGAALLDLAQWRAKDAKTAAVWKRLASMVATLALPLVFALALIFQPTPTRAAEVTAAQTVSYGNNIDAHIKPLPNSRLPAFLKPLSPVRRAPERHSVAIGAGEFRSR